ncbi:hypothetical protein [Sphingomonas adhaesiva]|uniref:hypothetical protein n=1 Tax=Sphingomonas adhaesiva TaxID=28212 RepID=UPI002FFC6592
MMKALFLASATLAMLAAIPSQAQLLGGGGGLGGGLAGGLGGNLGGGVMGGTMGSLRPTLERGTDRMRDTARSTTRTGRDVGGDVQTRRSIDRRSGKVSAGGDATGSAVAGLTNETQALGAPLSGSGSAAGSGRGSAALDAQLVGTDAVRDTASRVRDRATAAAGTARDRAQAVAGRARDTAGNAAGTARGLTGPVSGAVSGTASGTGSAAGSAGNGGASGRASGNGLVSLDAASPQALAPGARIEDARGRLVGRVQQVRRDAQGRVEAVDVAVGRQVSTLPAASLGADGDVLVTGQGTGRVSND